MKQNVKHFSINLYKRYVQNYITFLRLPGTSVQNVIICYQSVKNPFISSRHYDITCPFSRKLWVTSWYHMIQLFGLTKLLIRRKDFSLGLWGFTFFPVNIPTNREPIE